MGPDASPLISSPISAPSAVPYDHVLLPGDRFGDDAVCCTRMRMLSHPLEDLRIAILFLMKKKTEKTNRSCERVKRPRPLYAALVESGAARSTDSHPSHH